MRPWRRAVLIATLLAGLAMPRGGAAQEPARILDWETGENKSDLLPALEVPGFIFALNGVNRLLFDEGK